MSGFQTHALLHIRVVCAWNACGYSKNKVQKIFSPSPSYLSQKDDINVVCKICQFHSQNLNVNMKCLAEIFTAVIRDNI